MILEIHSLGVALDGFRVLGQIVLHVSEETILVRGLKEGDGLGDLLHGQLIVSVEMMDFGHLFESDGVVIVDGDDLGECSEGLREVVRLFELEGFRHEGLDPLVL